MIINYKTGFKAKEPIIIAEKVRAAYGEIVNIKLPNGEVRRGQVISINENNAVIEVFNGVSSINPSNIEITTTGRTALMELSPLIIGRAFNGAYKPIDNKEPIKSLNKVDINGSVINPTSRGVPNKIIETGFSAIDGLNTIVRGQKIALFSSKSINNYELTARLVKQSRISENEGFAVVFCGLGVPHEVADYFIKEFKKEGVMNRTVLFINKASDPIIERITAPRYALTAAEYLAFNQGMHVLTIMMDMTNYCNALRELSSAKEEIPMRMGYPSYMYSDLASIYERCGVIKGVNGSLTLIPILTMPNDDITHPIPDLTGYITEGQIILSNELSKKGINPPISVLPSLSRLMHNAINKEHAEIANQLYSSYARSQQVKETAAIIGVDSLSDRDKLFITFKEFFEKEFINQQSRRSLTQTLSKAMESLNKLSIKDLNELSSELIKKLENASAVKNHYTNE